MKYKVGDKFIYNSGAGNYWIEEVISMDSDNYFTEVVARRDGLKLGTRFSIPRENRTDNIWRPYKGHKEGDDTYGWDTALDSDKLGARFSIPSWCNEVQDTSIPQEPVCSCDMKRLSSYGCNCSRRAWLDKYATYNRVK